MKPLHLLLGLLLILSCLTFNLQAQTSRIAIVSVADTTIIHQHVGFTVFTNFIDTMSINFSIIGHLEKKLLTYLTPGYTVTVVQ